MGRYRGASLRRLGARPDERSGFQWRAAAVAAFAGLLVLYLWFWLVEGKPVGGSVFLVPVLLLLTAPALVRASRTELRFDLAGLMAVGLALRFGAAYYRWANGADAHTYNKFGTQFAESFRTLHFGVDTGAPVPGTGALRYITGLISVPTGADEFMKFCVFTWLGFWGCVLLYRAFVTALPDADHHRYACLIFLWPSLVFWPSSIGKEAWMLFTVGAAMLGVARVLRRERGGYSLLIVGLLAGGFVRPHVALLALLAFGIGLFVSRRETARMGVLTPSGVAKVAGLGIILLIGGVLVSRTEQVLDVGDTKARTTVTSTFERVRSQTSEGGSEYTPSDPKNPVGYVKGAVTVLFRPFPTEAHGLEQWLAAAEGVLLFGLLVTSRRRLGGLLRRLRDEPYYMVAIAYIAMFIYAFAAVGNFGILTRQRVQLMPFVFVLLAAPAVAGAAHSPRFRRRFVRS
jgi:hypothetical protein